MKTVFSVATIFSFLLGAAETLPAIRDFRIVSYA